MIKTKLPIKLMGKRQKRQEARMHEQIQNPEKLKLLVLSGSRLASSDFTFMLRCKNLIKLDLSDNQLSSLPEYFKLSLFPQLRLVYLHKNNFKSLEDIRPVLECQRLLHITLHDNPIYSSQLEHFLINVMKTLKMVNERIVFEQEKMNSVVINNRHVKINIDKLGAVEEEGEGEEVNMFIQGLDKQLEQIDKLWVNFNPLVKFQRLWRDRRIDRKTKRSVVFPKQIKKEEAEESQQRLLLMKYFQSWKTYKYGRQGVTEALIQDRKDYLVLHQKGYLTHQRNMRVNTVVQKFLDYIRTKVQKRKAVKVFQKHLSLKVLVFNSFDCFYTVSQISKTNRIIVARNQTSILQSILSHVNKITNKLSPYVLKECKDFISIRTVDSYRSETQKSLYRMFLQPSMQCIFLNRKPDSLKSTRLVNIKQLPYIIKANTKISQKDLRKIQMVYSQLARYSENQYENSLLEFHCEDPEYFKALIRTVFYHNCKCISLEMKKPDLPTGFNFLNPFSDQLVFYFDKELKRTTSAVMIQKTWRRYWSSRISAGVIEKIRKNRAALLIQNFYRGLQFKHRLNMNVEILKYLKEFTQPQMFLQEDIYMNICKIPISKEVYPQLTVYYNHQTIKIKGRYIKSPLNPCITEQFQSTKHDTVWWIGDNYHLLHVGASVQRVKVSGRIYLKFEYKSLAELKKRVALLALLSYKFADKGSYIKGLLKRDITADLAEYQKKIQRIYGFKIYKVKDKDEVKSIKSSSPVFIFPESAVDYFDGEKEPSESFQDVSIRLYCYTDYDEQPVKKDQKIIVSWRYFKDQPPPSIIDSEEPEPVETPRNSIANVRTNQKMKRLNQTLKNLTADPLQITKNIDSLHRIKERQHMHRKQQQIKQARQTNRNNKLISKEYKKVQIGKIKKWNRNMKAQVEYSRSQKEEDEQLRRDKIRSASMSLQEKRSSFQQKNDHEREFLQKGNFLFKQYMKMNIMREKMNDLEKKKASIPRKSQRARSESKRHFDLMDASVSFRQLKEQEQKELESPTYKSHEETSRYFEYPTQRGFIQQLSKTEQLIQKPRVKRTKQHMVHGVFPEQFYAIEKKKAGINLPLL